MNSASSSGEPLAIDSGRGGGGKYALLPAARRPAAQAPPSAGGPADSADAGIAPLWSSEPKGTKAILLDLAYQDYCQRQEAGETIDPDGFCERYPSFKASLRRLLEVHHFMEDIPLRGEETPAPAWPEPGDPFLGFRLRRELGRGAYARVYLATESALGNRAVAVKLSPRGAVEADILGRLNHPNIVPVHSVHREPGSGLTAVCMPYLGDTTLYDVLDRVAAEPRLPTRSGVIFETIRESGTTPALSAPAPRDTSYVEGVVGLGAQLAEALAFIHERGIYHLDLKPSNVLLSADGRPMLLDFNLSFAKQVAENRVGGTLPYMAPEQLLALDPDQGTTAAVDARSDIFSLGIILYELLTAKHPFGPVSPKLDTAAQRALLLKRQQSGFRPVRQANPQVDRALARLVERCLTLDVGRRYQSADTLARELRRRLSRPRRLVALLVLALAAGLAGGFGISLQEASQGNHIQEGQRAYQERHFDRAVAHFTRAIKIEPSAEAFFARGRAHQQLKEIDQALADYACADKLRPDAWTHVCWGYCKCLKNGAMQQDAIWHFQQAIRMQEMPGTVYNDLGYSCVQQKRLDEAKHYLDKAIQLDPGLQAAYHNRALVDLTRSFRDSQHVPTAGIKDIRQAIALGPGSAELYYNAAQLCALAARHDPSWRDSILDYLRQAVELGHNPIPLTEDHLFQGLVEAADFQNLLLMPPAAHPALWAVRWVDPIRDLGN